MTTPYANMSLKAPKDRTYRDLQLLLADRAVLSEVISAPTAVAATCDLLRRVGLHPCAVTGHTRTAYGVRANTWVSALVVGDEMGQCTIEADMEREWKPEATITLGEVLDGSLPLSGIARKRARLAGQHAAAVVNGNLNVTEVLSTPPNNHPAAPAFLLSTAGAWWQARLAQGHSAESARFLLGMIADPSLLAFLRAQDPEASFLP